MYRYESKADAIYQFCKPNLGGISFHGETNADDDSIRNLDNYCECIIRMLEDMEATAKQTDGRYERSAQKLNRKIATYCGWIAEEVEYIQSLCVEVDDSSFFD